MTRCKTQKNQATEAAGLIYHALKAQLAASAMAVSVVAKTASSKLRVDARPSMNRSSTFSPSAVWAFPIALSHQRGISVMNTLPS